MAELYTAFKQKITSSGWKQDFLRQIHVTTCWKLAASDRFKRCKLLTDTSESLYILVTSIVPSRVLTYPTKRDVRKIIDSSLCQTGHWDGICDLQPPMGVIGPLGWFTVLSAFLCSVAAGLLRRCASFFSSNLLIRCDVHCQEKWHFQSSSGLGRKAVVLNHHMPGVGQSVCPRLHGARCHMEPVCLAKFHEREMVIFGFWFHVQTFISYLSHCQTGRNLNMDIRNSFKPLCFVNAWMFFSLFIYWHLGPQQSTEWRRLQKTGFARLASLCQGASS